MPVLAFSYSLCKTRLLDSVTDSDRTPDPIATLHCTETVPIALDLDSDSDPDPDPQLLRLNTYCTEPGQ